MSSAVLFEKINQHIGLVTINRPNAMNAVNGDVAQGIAALVDKTEADADIWVVILTGAGDRAFCAGADLKEISRGNARSLSVPEKGFGGLVYAKRTKPWIAAVGGFALAGGTELALSCDMIVASEKSKFGLPEVTRGIIAAAGGMFRLPRVMPKAIAMEYLATGKHIPVEQALQFGMINRLVPNGEHLAGAIELATSIIENAPIAVRESLTIARQAFDLADAELIQLTKEANLRIHHTADAKEGPLAFVEKRKPNWTGK